MKQHKLLKDYMKKNELNIEQIINDYSGYVYTIIKNISSQEQKQEDIEEIISDTFFVLWKNAHKMNENVWSNKQYYEKEKKRNKSKS